ncbi:MAG: antibiotic biosynthesis monooxygenase [Anaerolineae bacterium]|nr:antibiotic biosynthesis monooxygenase [Anaerolineae bacterium]
MIIRIFKSRVQPGQRERFEQFFRGKAVDNVRAHAGLVSVTAGSPIDGVSDEYVMITVWRDLDALKGFIGDNWNRPFIDPDEADLIADVTVQHFEGGAV